MKFAYNDGGRGKAGHEGSAGDCVCRAITIGTQIPYRVVRAMLCAYYAEMRPRWDCDVDRGVNKVIYRRMLDDLGWSWHPCVFIGSGVLVRLRPEDLPPGRLIVRLEKHLAAVVDGVLHDTHNFGHAEPSENRCVYGYWQPPGAPLDIRAEYREAGGYGKRWGRLFPEIETETIH